MAVNYVIKRASSAAEVQATIIGAELAEGWMPAIDDVELAYSTDPQGLFVGELDGEQVSSISLVRHGESFAFIGYYNVIEEHRGKGYGLAIWKHALDTLPSSYNIALDTEAHLIPLYGKSGFKETHLNHRSMIDIAVSSAKLHNYTTPPEIVVQPAKQVEFDKLSAYDNAAFGAPHHRFLKGLLDGPNTVTLAATSTAGEVVGFVAARKTIIEEEGWKIAPLYADSEQIVRAILKEVLQEMSKDSPDRKVAIFNLSPREVNPGAHVLAEELDATRLMDMWRMYTKGPLEFAKERVYSFGSIDLG